MVDLRELTSLCGFTDLETFGRAHRQWIEQALEVRRMLRDDRWSDAIAVGSVGFVESVKGELGSKALHRGVEQIGGAYTLREQSESYDGNLPGETEPLRLENTFLWEENAETAEASVVRPCHTSE